jgi:hypothetical protein
MAANEVLKTLDAGRVHALSRRSWTRLRKEFSQHAAHDTGLAGMLLVGELSGRLVAVEEAGRDQIAIRGFASRRAADQFVKKRLDQYDRLWDG